ncbi:hypothetical protein J1N35_019551 [Gossypium stocksii]|uniref:Uncharacterized protein n=1 Tax=Gossypium stocksii TaxID=47602 RepID=A0A9D3VR43_9ROSI|nr:hypothetical protein J1N35_019551 [Gossypium stocksii]
MTSSARKISYTFFSIRHFPIDFPSHPNTLLNLLRFPLPFPLPLVLQISAIARYPNPHINFRKSCAILKNNDEKIWSRTNARVGVKGVGSTVLGLSQNLRLYVQFSTPVKRGLKPSKKEGEK